MEIRPVSNMPLMQASAAPAPKAEAESMPKETFVSSSNSAIVCDNSGNLAELKKTLLAQHPGSTITADLPLVNGFSISIPKEEGNAAEVLAGLEKQGAAVFPDIELGSPDSKEVQDLADTFSPILDGGNVMLGAEKLHEQGITGKGITVCVIDSGVAPHPDLGDRLIAFKDCVNGNKEPYDDCGHGTHCAGIIAGDGTSSGGKTVGVAPEANIVGVKVLDAWGNGSTSQIIRGIQWAVTHKHKYHIDVINMSLGRDITRPRLLDPMTMAVQAASLAGITVVCSAGNEGAAPGTICSPGNAPRAITVGALDTQGTESTEDDFVAYFSSRGPTKFDNLNKPDIVAPGVDINSLSNDGTGYKKMSGTSMAAPFTAGVAALMKQVKPNLRPSQLKELMTGSVFHSDYQLDHDSWGAGIVDPVESVEAAKHGSVRFPYPRD